MSLELCVSAGCDRRPAVATATAPAGWKTYLDPNGAFRVHYPPNFEPRKTASSDIAGLFMDESHDALVVTSEVHDGPISISKTLDLTEKSARERLTQYNHVERTELTLAGCPAGRTVHSGMTKSGSDLATSTLVVVLPGHRAVAIAFSCPAARYDVTKSTRETIERTFEMLANK